MVSGRRPDQVTGYAFVTFENRDDAGAAKKDAHGMDIDGRTIRTDYCISGAGAKGLGKRRFYRSRSRERRRGSPSREYRRRSRSRSRDKYRSSYRDRSHERRRSPSYDRHRRRDRH